MTKTAKMASLIAFVIAGVGSSVVCAQDVHKLNSRVSAGMLSIYEVNKGTVSEMNAKMSELARDVSVMVWDEQILGKQKGFFYERIMNDYIQEGNFEAASLVLTSLHKEIALEVVNAISNSGGEVSKGLKVA